MRKSLVKFIKFNMNKSKKLIKFNTDKLKKIIKFDINKLKKLYHGHKADTIIDVQLIKYITHEVTRRQSFEAISIAEIFTLSLFQNR